MAFFRNYGSVINSGLSVFSDKGPHENGREEEHSVIDDKPGRDSHSEEEQVDDNTSQYENAGGITIGNETENIQPSGRRNFIGKWGSSFWKDCQPTSNDDALQTGRNPKSEDLNSNMFNNNHSNRDGDETDSVRNPESDESDECKSIEESESNSSDGKNDRVGVMEFERQTNTEEVLMEHAHVPAEEMSSDDYYEQDGENRNDSLISRRINRHSSSSLRFPSQPTAVNRNKSKSSKSKALSFNQYVDDEEYDEEEEVDEDDPADADFEPDSEDTKGNHRTKDKEWNSEDSIDDDDNFDVDISDEDDLNFSNNFNHRKLQKRVKRRKVTESIPLLGDNRRKRGKHFTEEDESSAKDSIGDNDEDFDHTTKRSAYLSNKIGNQNNLSANFTVDSSEVRMSRRPVRKVSYVESEESEEIDEGKNKKLHRLSLEDIEEDDGDSIEKVLWHQPKNMVEEDLKNKTQPVISSSTLYSELDWNEVDFFIKWKGHSYLHCSWKPLSDLQNLTGSKKVMNYMKRMTEETRFRNSLTREEAEVHDVAKEMEIELLKQYSQVERIFADRINRSGSDDVSPEYLVKWQGLSYAEATWEKDTDIAFAQDLIDEYKTRGAGMMIQGKMVDFQRKKSKASLRRLDEQPDWLKGGKLRDYQLEGLNFLVNSWRNDTNVILADEMGLGKTVQSISMLGFLKSAQQIYGPFLVVVPLSTLSNWAKEFRKWLPDMNVVVYIGNRASREVCQQYEFFSENGSGRQTKFNALLTTYEVVLKDKMVFSKIKWNYLMVDEAHRLKNCEASLYTTLSEFSTKNKLLITGTPLQNSVEELWALLHFLDSEKFKNKDDFVEKYKNLSSFNEIELGNLHKELRPHILRRVIKDVEKSLPPKIERILRVEMSPLQKQYYKWILERNFHDLNKGVRGNQVSLLNIVVELKKCCNHPFLFESADHGYGGDTNISGSSKVERIILSSGKLVILDKLLVRLRETNHRVLIFSQMVKMLDILAEYLTLRGFQFQRLDGSTRADLRHQAMEHFNAPGSDDFCFLLSTRAGGLGINLATADTVIIFDSDWNPQNDLQAMSRAHRIGQQEVVNIYRFVTSKSVEEDILERAKKKMVLDHLVIQKLNAEGRLEKKEVKKGSSMFDKNELSAILRFGAEELFKEDKNDEESKKKLESMDIDEILERAEKIESKVVGEEQGNELLSAFKVANFCSAEDDATFWSRWIQPEAVDRAKDGLVPRAAKNIKSYAEANKHEETNKRKRKTTETQKKNLKRGSKTVDISDQNCLPKVEGAAAQVRGWSYGNLSKKEATLFARAVKKFGTESHIGVIAAEVGGSVEASPIDAQIELFDSLLDGCKEAVRENHDIKNAVLDFFGTSVKATELLDRVQELQMLEKRIKHYKDPVTQFRLLTYIRDAPWSKGCAWNQVDDARLLLGVYYHGFGNWEKIRLDSGLGLTRKIAPVTLGNGETFLPRAPQLDLRAASLLRKEFAAVGGKTSKGKVVPPKVSREEDDKFLKTRKLVPLKINARTNKETLPKRQKVDPRVKEEGEVSETEDNSYAKFKEEKWKEWCEEVMQDEMHTLKRLQKLQTTSENLPKEKVLFKIRNYLQLLGRKVDSIVQQHAETHKRSKMTRRLWNHVGTFSHIPGERLAQIYSKLKQEWGEAAVGSSYINCSTSSPCGRDNNDLNHCLPSNNENQKPRSHQKFLVQSFEAPHSVQKTSTSEAWKRRRRGKGYHTQGQSVPPSNSNWVPDPSSLGILGSAPGATRRFNNNHKQENRIHQPHFSSLSGQNHPA